MFRCAAPTQPAAASNPSLWEYGDAAAGKRLWQPSNAHTPRDAPELWATWRVRSTSARSLASARSPAGRLA